MATLLLIAVAMTKMGLYMSAFGLTPKRVLVTVFLVWLALVFALIWAALRRELPVVRIPVLTGAVLFTPLTAQLDGQAVREACPYDIPRIDPATQQIHKRDFCNDRAHQGMLPACVLSCPTGCMNFGEREDMENLAEQRLAEVKERFPNAVLGDNGIVHVIYLYAEDPNLYHKFAVFARNDADPMTRRQLFAKLRRPVA